MCTFRGLNDSEAKMEFSLELLHMIMGNQDTTETFAEGVRGQVFTEEEMTVIKTMTEQITALERANQNSKLAELRDHLFSLFDLLG